MIVVGEIMKQYKVKLWYSGLGFSEPFTQTVIVTCNEIVKEMNNDKVLYADGKKIEFEHAVIVDVFL